MYRLLLSIEVMYDRYRVNIKVERGSTFVFTRDLPYIASISFYFIYARKIYVRMHLKITQPLEGKLNNLIS